MVILVRNHRFREAFQIPQENGTAVMDAESLPIQILPVRRRSVDFLLKGIYSWRVTYRIGIRRAPEY
jgi:acetolactate synthase regulatory subunit